ncbi:hypothetical protein SKAU_G00004260 [Synaphobranchus kaupii]|uniref:Uncharacterized protein n=1 Tax=Synaphobranchus kaupii TaxID=118154 RepID=A0A9Q1JBI8_SYNKA|nr:hypothetical protein SKAU_G00004260 [Synaphobranchus kaupii]
MLPTVVYSTHEPIVIVGMTLLSSEVTRVHADEKGRQAGRQAGTPVTVTAVSEGTLHTEFEALRQPGRKRGNSNGGARRSRQVWEPRGPVQARCLETGGGLNRTTLPDPKVHRRSVSLQGSA